MDERYPVLVTGTMKYLVWIDAENAAEAHLYAQSDTYEYIGDAPAVDAWLDVEQDPDETSHFIWMYGSQFMPQHDNHVHAHRWATREAAG